MRPDIAALVIGILIFVALMYADATNDGEKKEGE